MLTLFLTKSSKNIWWRIDSLFNKCCWENGYLPAENGNWIYACTSINSNWINIIPETLKLVQERAGNILKAKGKKKAIGKEFLSRTQVAQQLRERMNKWDYMKLKSFCTTKEMVSKLKRPPTEWEKNLCWLYIKGLITRIYRVLKKTKLL
jgi:hypothetical protein